jgi:hypothetical protein
MLEHSLLTTDFYIIGSNTCSPDMEGFKYALE